MNEGSLALDGVDVTSTNQNQTIYVSVNESDGSEAEDESEGSILICNTVRIEHILFRLSQFQSSSLIPSFLTLSSSSTLIFTESTLTSTDMEAPSVLNASLFCLYSNSSLTLSNTTVTYLAFTHSFYSLITCSNEAIDSSISLYFCSFSHLSHSASKSVILDGNADLKINVTYSTFSSISSDIHSGTMLTLNGDSYFSFSSFEGIHYAASTTSHLLSALLDTTIQQNVVDTQMLCRWNGSMIEIGGGECLIS